MPQQNANYWDQFEQNKTDKPDDFFNQFESAAETKTEQPPVDNRGMLRKTWDFATNPLVDIPIGDAIDFPSEFRSPNRARLEGFIGGVGQGLVDDAVSPLGIATAGIGTAASKLGKAGIRGIGALTEGAGKFLEDYNPLLSNMFEPGLIKAGRKLVGSGLEAVGNKMRRVGSAIDRYMPNQSGARLQNLENNAPMDFGPSDLEQYLPNKSGYRPNQILDEPVNIEKSVITNEDYADLGDKAANLSSYKSIRTPEGESLSPIAKQYLSKRQLRSNSDGTFTDVNTGEVLNSKGENIIEINGKPIDRNSSFFKRNRQ